LITDPLVEIRMDLPSGENFSPVHTISLLSTLNLKEEKGPLSKDLRSYSLTASELIPAAKIRPSGSKAATGRPDNFIKP